MSTNSDGFHDIPIRGNSSNLPITQYDIDAGIRLSLKVHQEVNINIQNIQIGGNYFNADVVIVNGDSNLVFNQDLTTKQVGRYYIYYKSLPEIDKEKEVYINQSIRDETGSETFCENFIAAALKRYYLLYNWLVDPISIAEKAKEYIIGDKPEDEISPEDQQVIDSITKIATEKDEKIKAYHQKVLAEAAAKAQALSQARKKFEEYVLQNIKTLSDDFKKLIEDSAATLNSCEFCVKPSVDDAVSRFNSDLEANQYFPFKSVEDAEKYGFCRVEGKNDWLLPDGSKTSIDGKFWVLNGDCDYFMTSEGPVEYDTNNYSKAIEEYNKTVEKEKERIIFNELDKVNAYNNYAYMEPAYNKGYENYKSQATMGGFVVFEPFEGGADWCDSGLMKDMVNKFLDPTLDTRGTENITDSYNMYGVIEDRNKSYEMYENAINAESESANALFKEYANKSYNQELEDLYINCTNCTLRRKPEDIIGFLYIAPVLNFVNRGNNLGKEILEYPSYVVEGFHWKNDGCIMYYDANDKDCVTINEELVEICKKCCSKIEFKTNTLIGSDEYKDDYKNYCEALDSIQKYIELFINASTFDKFINNEENVNTGYEIVDNIRNEKCFDYWYKFTDYFIKENCDCLSKEKKCNYYCPPLEDCDHKCNQVRWCCREDDDNVDKERDCDANGYEWGHDGNTYCNDLEDNCKKECEENNESYKKCDTQSWVDYMFNNPKIFEDFGNLWNDYNNSAYLFRMIFTFYIMNSFSKNSGIPIDDPTFSDPCHPIYSTIKSCFGCPLRYVSTPTKDPDSCECSNENDPLKNIDPKCYIDLEPEAEEDEEEEEEVKNVKIRKLMDEKEDEINRQMDNMNEKIDEEGKEYGYFEFYDKKTNCTCGRVPIETIVNALHIDYENRAEYYYRFYREYRVENYITINSIQQGVSTNTINIHMADSTNVNLEVDEEIKTMQKTILLFDSIDKDVLGLPSVECEIDPSQCPSDEKDDEDDSNKSKKLIILVIIIIVLIFIMFFIFIIISQLSTRNKHSHKSSHKSSQNIPQDKTQDDTQEETQIPLDV